MLSAGSLEGQILKGCYRIEKRVGKGGMAWVYRAHHTLLNVPVAIKILLPNLAEEENIRHRFITEAKVMFQLRHPHIVQVTDIIQEGDLIGMVMEWVQGEDLDQWLKRQEAQITWKQFWRLCAPFLGAMDYIHRKGLVHRDLKLSNIMLHYEGNDVILKVSDFGLVKVLDEMSEDNLTQTGTRMGTVAYMSPEQIKDAKGVGVASDIYSIGVVLYKLLTRKLPFSGDAHYVMLQHIDATPPPVREQRADVPEAVDGVIMRCLEKAPGKRWETCALMAEAMRQALLESGCLDVEQAESFQVSGDPDAADNTWHSMAQKRFSQWDGTQPEWMREQAYGSKIHRSQSGLTEGQNTPPVASSEMTRIVQPTGSRLGLWLGLIGVLVVLLAVGGWWMFRPTPTKPVSSIPSERPEPRTNTQTTPTRQGLSTEPRRDIAVDGGTIGEPRLAQRDVLPRTVGTRNPEPRRNTGEDDDPEEDDPKTPTRRVVKRQVQPVLLIESSPAGAELWQGSKKVGVTPYHWKGRTGQAIHWTLKQRGYQPKDGSWTFTARRQAHVQVQMAPQWVELPLQSVPAGATVWIRGRRVGETPYVYRGLPGTTVSFVLKKDKFREYKGVAKLTPSSRGQTIKLEPFLNDPFAP